MRAAITRPASPRQPATDPVVRGPTAMIVTGPVTRQQWGFSGCQEPVLIVLEGAPVTSSLTAGPSAHFIPQIDHHSCSCSGSGVPGCASADVAPAHIR